MGLYLGPSLRQVRYVLLIIKLEKFMVSTLLHVQHRNFFDMVPSTSRNLPKLSQWKNIDGFKQDRPHHVQPQELGSGTDSFING